MYRKLVNISELRKMEFSESEEQSSGQSSKSCYRHLQRLTKLDSMMIRQFSAQIDQYQSKFKELLDDDCSEEKIKVFFENVSSKYWDQTKNNPLHIAAAHDNENAVKYLISLGCDVNLKNACEKTPIWVAMEEENLKTFKILLDAGASLDNQYYKHSNGLLHFAAGEGNVEIVRMLIEAGADVDALNGELNSPLHLVGCLSGADKVKAVEIAKMFVQANANLCINNCVGETALFCAVGNDELAFILLDAGASISARNCISQTLLHISVHQGQFDLTRRLLEKKIDINALDSKNKSAVCYAIQTGNYEMVKMLVDNGASTNFSLNKGFCPLHEAIRADNPPLVYYLLTLETNVNLLELREPVQGLTCLLIAAQFGRKDVVKRLLEHGADINAKSDQGFGVLYYAAIPNFKHYSNYTDYSDLIKLLVLRGADICLEPTRDPNAKLIDGPMLHWPSPTTLDYILYQAKEEIVRLLVERGLSLMVSTSSDAQKLLCSAMRNEHDQRVFKFLFNTLNYDLNTKDAQGETLLHKAVLYQNVSSLKYLLKRGGAVNCQNEAGMAPLHLAIKCYNIECVCLLLFFKANLNCQLLPLSLATENDSNFDFHVRSSLRYCKPYTSFALLRMTNRNSSPYSSTSAHNKSRHKKYPTSIENIRKEIARQILKYLAVLELLGEPVNPSNYGIIYSHSDLNNYYKTCKTELKLMQDYSIGDSSLLEVLFKFENKSCHKEISEALADLQTKETFSVYGDIIDEYCRRMNKSPELIDKLRSMKIES